MNNTILPDAARDARWGNNLRWHEPRQAEEFLESL